MWKVGETAEWIVCPSDCNHFYQKLLTAIYQFFESKQYGVSDFES